MVYANDMDIPSSPREPSDSFSNEQVKEESFGTPIEETQVCDANRLFIQSFPSC